MLDRIITSRSVFALLWMSLGAVGCDEPSCPYGLERTGDYCRPTGDASSEVLADGGPDAADSANGANAEADAAGPRSDASASVEPDPTCADNPEREGCEACEAGVFRCEDQRLERCGPDGFGWRLEETCGTGTQCDAEAAICANQSCTERCGAPANECLVASCEGATCGTVPKRAHAACATGVCDGAGACVACAGDSDCTSGNTNLCVNNACVECRSATDCNQAAHEICTAGSCVVGPFCGDGAVNGGEACDPTAAGWDVYTCSETCAQRKLYNSCNTPDPAWGGLTCEREANCGLSYCSVGCTVAADCPQSPKPNLVAACPATMRVCVVTGCTANADCPAGVPCQTVGTGERWCWGCGEDSHCGPGQRCVRRTLPSGGTTTTGLCE